MRMDSEIRVAVQARTWISGRWSRYGGQTQWRPQHATSSPFLDFPCITGRECGPSKNNGFPQICDLLSPRRSHIAHSVPHLNFCHLSFITPQFYTVVHSPCQVPRILFPILLCLLYFSFLYIYIYEYICNKNFYIFAFFYLYSIYPIQISVIFCISFLFIIIYHASYIPLSCITLFIVIL